MSSPSTAPTARSPTRWCRGFSCTPPFIVGAACWALSTFGSIHRARWTRWFSTLALLAGGATLIFFFMVAEHGTAILPIGYRILCLCATIYAAIAILIAWLPTTGRITA